MLILGSLFCSGQNNEQEAFKSYKEARDAYQNENFEQASSLLLKTTRLLGSTNIRIQPMLIKSLVGIEDWRQASVEITIYYGLEPDKELVEYQEIVTLQDQVNNKIQEEEALFSSAKTHESVTKYQTYLNDFPFGKYRDEAQRLLGDQKDENAWKKADDVSSTNSYYQYLAEYPNGNHSTTARETIKRWDRTAYEIAVNTGTQRSFNNYLTKYPRGAYRSEAREKLAERKEYDAYKYAVDNNYIENYEAYISKYPEGKYADEVNRIIKNSYYRFGNEAFDAKNYSKAKGHYQTYLERYPYGYQANEVRKKITKCNNQLNQRGASFVMYTYDNQSPLGISFGDINKGYEGFYMDIKMNPGILTGLDVLWNIDNYGNSNSPWDIDPTGLTRQANFALSGGVTFKLAYPLWGYIGGGAGFYTQYDQIDEYSYGSFYDTVWMLNTDETSWRVFPEFGVKLKVSNALVLRYGVMHQKELFHQVGFGFQI